MQDFVQKVRRLLTGEEGPTAVEYAIMLALIIVVCFAAIATIGNPTTSSFSRVVDDGGFGSKS